MKKIALLLMFLLAVLVGRTQSVSFGTNYVENSQTHLPIIFSDFQENVGAISLAFNYDTTLLEYSHTVLINPALIASNLNMSNNIGNKYKFGWFTGTANGFPFDGTVIEVVFNNKKLDCAYLDWSTAPGDCEISSDDMLPGNQLVEILPVTFICPTAPMCVSSYNVDISGNVYYHNSSANIYPIMVYLYGPYYNYIDSQGSMGGSYSFCDVPAGTYSIDASTMQPAGGVNAIDALLTAKQYVGIEQLDPVQKLAADVNLSGYINTSDALSILNKFTQGTQFQQPWIFKWRTIEAYSNSNTYDIEAICKGDVNNSYMGNPFRQALDTTINIVKFGDPRYSYFPQTSFTEVPLLFENFTNSINSISLKFTFDPTKFAWYGFSGTNPLLNSGTGVLSTTVVSDTVIISWFDINMQNINNDTVITFVFENINGCDDLTWLDSIPFTACDISTDDSTGNAYSLEINCIDKYICTPNTGGLSTVNEHQPKIYAHSQTIYIENLDYKNVEVYDMLGRLVISEKLVNGLNMIPVNEQNIYLVRLTSEHNVVTKKIKI